MSSLLNLSESAFLALHGMVIIAKAAPEKVRIKALASELKASEAHLAKVFQRLQKNGLLKSTRGPAGGYSFANSPEKISLLDIYEAVESKINMKICPFGKLDCMYDTCVFDSSISALAQNIYSTFANLKLSDYL
ncbi:MAG: Rrf2 family transcriptional regulator [Candidatus Cloacimonetes bacterium]|nr:Rrf2 family transcriptional regulator [Candidatus Cloacimonadota bacterium]